MELRTSYPNDRMYGTANQALPYVAPDDEIRLWLCQWIEPKYCTFPPPERIYHRIALRNQIGMIERRYGRSQALRFVRCLREGGWHPQKATTAELYRECQLADDAWSAELRRRFGRDACNARYQPRGEGKPGEDLYQAYRRYKIARGAWHAGIAQDRARRRAEELAPC